MYGQILPGYITESMLKEQAAEKAENTPPEKKPSIRKQLADNKAKAADIPKRIKQKNKDLEV